MEKWVIIGLEHLVFPEDKAMLKKAKDGGMPEGHRCRPQRAPNCQSWNNLSNKINNMILVTTQRMNPIQIIKINKWGRTSNYFFQNNSNEYMWKE